MSVQLVIGRAKAGKTRWCVDRAIELARADPLGPAVYFVVPKQATFAVQRRLALNSGLDGFCRIRVTTFDRLADEVIAECGGDAIPSVTPRGRRIVIAHLLRQFSDRLRVYRASAGRSGLAEELDSTFAELETHGHDAQTLGELIHRLSSDAPGDSAASALIDKLHDIRLLYDAYQAFLADERVDPHRRLAQVLELLPECQAIRGSTVLIDGHLDLAHFEGRLIAALARHAESVRVTMLMDADTQVQPGFSPGRDEHALFHRAHRTAARLLKVLTDEGIAIDAPIRLRAAPTRDSTIDFIERSMFVPSAGNPPNDDQAITLAALPNRRDEVAFAASTIQSWMQREHLRPRQIAVLVRDLSTWHDLIEAEFAERQIPFFTDRRRTASHHPLLQVVAASLAAALEGFGHEAMMTLAKSGLCGVGRSEADLLENYVLRHAITGSGWTVEAPWTFAQRRRDDRDEDESIEPIEPDFADGLRRKLVAPVIELAKALGRAGKPRTIREMTAALYRAIVDYGADDALARLVETAEAEGRLEVAAEHEQVWNALVELLDEVVDLLGDEPIAPTEFAVTIAGALAEFDLAITPPTADQVIVGDIERTRYEHFDAVLLLGWNEGEFPCIAAEPTVLGDAERKRLHGSLDLNGDTRRRLLDESLLAYIALTRARRMLCITRRLADDDGREMNRSLFLRELGSLLPAASSREQTEVTLPTTRQLVLRLADWARAGAPAEATAALYHAVVTADLPIRGVVERAWPALRYLNDAKLAPETIAALFGPTLQTSVSGIESFAKCPYQHFARQTLRLKPRIEPTVTALDMGALMHGVLERLVGEQVRRRQPWGKGMPARKKISDAAQAVAAELRGELMLNSARNRYVLRTIEDAVDRMLRWQHEIGSAGALEPAGVEVAFGEFPEMEGLEGVRLDPLELTTPGKRTVRLRGLVDRIDVSRAGKHHPFAVFDYKRSRDKLELGEVYHGLALQLLTYLLVLEANGHKLTGAPLAPVAAFYVKLMRAIERVDHPDAEPSVPQLRGLINLAHVGVLGESAGLALGLTKDGKFHAQRAGDSASAREFSALLAFVRDKIRGLADQIAEGDIGIRPYYLRNCTPCKHCDFQALCRFEVPINRYTRLLPLARKDVLDLLVPEGEENG